MPEINEPKWEAVRPSDASGHRDAVRRIEVPGGWLYQVQIGTGYAQATWHPPVFVAALVIEER